MPATTPPDENLTMIYEHIQTLVGKLMRKNAVRSRLLATRPDALDEEQKERVRHVIPFIPAVPQTTQVVQHMKNLTKSHDTRQALAHGQVPDAVRYAESVLTTMITEIKTLSPTVLNTIFIELATDRDVLERIKTMTSRPKPIMAMTFDILERVVGKDQMRLAVIQKSARQFSTSWEYQSLMELFPTSKLFENVPRPPPSSSSSSSSALFRK
jgi:hypothetical protein